MVNRRATEGREAGDATPPIRLSSSNLGAFLEISPDALVLINQTGIIMMVNQQAEALFDYPRAQLLDQPLEQLLPERFRGGHREHRTRYFSSTARTRPMGAGLPLFGLRQDGTEFPLDISLKPLLLDERLVALAAVRDMSAQRHMEEELARRSGQLERTHLSAYQLASIFDSSGEAIISKTLEGVITSWNSSAEYLYGYGANEVLGKSISLIIPPDQQEELSNILERIRVGETIQRYETVRVRKDETLIAVSVTVSPIRDVEGRIIGASTIAHDITEQKRMIEELATRSRELESSVEELATRSRELEGSNKKLESSVEELIALNSVLEEANQARSQFLSTMSHELRTPLASITGFSEMLLEDARDAGWSQQQQGNLERILTNSEHLLGLINDVLDLSKIEAGRMVLDSRQVNPRDLLSDVAAEIGSLAVKRNLFLKTEVEEGIGCLETNSGKLHQILLNLVSNALKFTEQGGVTLSVSRVLLSDEGTEGMAFAVQDSGIGIPPDIQERIFEAFYQADMSYTRRVGGTGLGLAIVSQLTALLEGTVTVASVPGQGSTFTVTLPVKVEDQLFIEQDLPRLHQGQPQQVLTRTPAAREFAPAPSPDKLEGSGQRDATEEHHDLIVVVDDNPDAIVFIKNALLDTPYTVMGVQDPLTVMELVQELHPCAIMLDVMMPDLNGWQLLHQLKDNPATASIPVVMLTVLTEQMTGYVLGADDYLIKPFKKGVLRHTLQHLLEAKNGLSEANKREAQQVARGD